MANAAVAVVGSEQQGDSRAILDAMHGATPTPTQNRFADSRALRDWDGIASSVLARDGADDRVRTALMLRVLSGLTPLTREGIIGTISTGSERGTEGTLELREVGGIPAASQGLSAIIPLTLTAEPLDRLLFGGQAILRPSPLASALGRAEALSVTDLDTMGRALAADVGCDALARALVDTSTGVAYLGCDAPCLSATCEAALGALWKGLESTDIDGLPFEIAASGAVTRIDGDARPVAFEGTWVGTTTLASRPARLGGTATLGTGALVAP
jgi:hypothetical protein